MARFEYDEAASEAEHMDVVYEVPPDKAVPVARWVELMRRLNSIEEPLARRLLKLHQDCGSGSDECDSTEGDPVTIANRSGWGCETTRLIADYFGVDYPECAPARHDDAHAARCAPPDADRSLQRRRRGAVMSGEGLMPEEAAPVPRADAGRDASA